jgi:hypothetical protein
MTTTTDPLDALKVLPWPDLGLDGEPDRVAAFVRTARDRWQEIVDALKAPIAVPQSSGGGSSDWLGSMRRRPCPDMTASPAPTTSATGVAPPNTNAITPPTPTINSTSRTHAAIQRRTLTRS